MFDHRFDTMVTHHCQIFASLFQPMADEVFKRRRPDHSGGLDSSHRHFHEGEYGALRELLVDMLLTPFTPTVFEIRGGFVVAANLSQTPLQCDILVCSRDSTPFLSRLEFGPFYPKEAVAIVGECKSRIRECDLGEIIAKMQQQLTPWQSKTPKEHQPVELPNRWFPSIEELAADIKSWTFQDPFSFLICDRLVPSNDDESGENRRSPVIWANVLERLSKSGRSCGAPAALLSVHDGLLVTGKRHETQSFTAAVHPSKDSCSHIKLFLSIYYQFLMQWKHQLMPIQDYLRVDPSDILVASSEPVPEEEDQNPMGNV